MSDIVGRLHLLSFGRCVVPASKRELIEAADEIERLRARRPVVCTKCGGTGVEHIDDCKCCGRMYDDGTEYDPPLTDPCPDCGNDGCGPGVRWET